MSALTPFNPDSWMDVLVLLGLGVLSVIAAGLPLWITTRRAATTAAATSVQVAEIHEQAVNDHRAADVNLRDQLDRMERHQREHQESQRVFEAAITSELRGLRKDIGRLADSAVDDRDMHHQDVARIDAAIERIEKRIT